MLVLFEFLQFSSFFFYSGFQSLCRSLQNFKKSDHTRCLASTILTGILKEERNSVVIRRVNIGDPAY